MRPAVSALPVAASRRGRPPMAGLRQNILRSAEDIFTRHDYHEVLMEDVARASGVAKGTVYRYFPSKRALYLGVMFEGVERLQQALRAALDNPVTPVRKIESAVRCVLGHFWDRRFFLTLINRNEHKPWDPDNREWLRRRAELSRTIQRAVEEAMQAGYVRRVDARVATEMLLGMLRGANRYRGTHDSLEDMVSAVVEVFLRGVGTATGQRLTGTGLLRRR